MKGINGLRIIALNERILGKVVEHSKNNIYEFRIMEYYKNQYEEYMCSELISFIFTGSDDNESNIKSFKKKLANYVALREVYVRDEIIDFLKT